MNTSHEYVRRWKFGSGLQKEALYLTRLWKQNQLTSMLKLQQKTRKKIQGVCSWLNFHTHFLSPGDYLQIVVVNKPLCSKLRQSFLCSLTFPTVESKQNLTTNIDMVIQLLTCSSICWYKLLFSTIMLLISTRHYGHFLEITAAHIEGIISCFIRYS